MNYEEARSFIDRISASGSVLGLEAVTRLLDLLGNPQDELKFIHIAGTNGKGSVLAYLLTVLEKAGYRVGRYNSPTLFSYRERIQVNGTDIGREAFAELATQVSDAMDEMKQRGWELPTVFEAETAISFLYFRQQRCDLVLLETGMGGRQDATNVIRTPVLTALASISMDHMEYLGGTIAEIAWNKAGIFKPGVPVISTQQPQEAEEVIACEAEKLGCPCTFVRTRDIRELESAVDRQRFTYRVQGPSRSAESGAAENPCVTFENVEIHLAGRHQLENAALALECVCALRALGYAVSDEALRAGLRETVWRGRFTPVCREPLVILDGAHNPDAALRLRDAVTKYFADRKKYYIFGVFSDKEYDKIIEITARLAEHIFAVETPDNPRALPAQELAKAVRRVNPSVEAAESIAEAVQKSFQLAEPDDVILAFGSLSFLAEVECAVKGYGEDL